MLRLTKPQRLIYDMEKFHGGSISVICGSIVTRTEYPGAALTAAVNELYRLNDALRIRIVETDSGPMQEIEDYAQREVKVLHFESKAELDAYLTASAESGNQYAQYTLGKLYLMGQEVPQDKETAWYWFTQSAAQGNQYAQFFLDRWSTMGPPSVMLCVTRLLYHMSRIFQAETPSPAVLGGIQIDRKRLQQLREKKIAMGHKPDDHEKQQMGWGGMSM